MFGRLIRPFRKRYDKYAGKVGAFAKPVWNATMDLLGKVPSPKAFAGSEDLAEDDGGSAEAEGAVAESGKPDLLGRLKNFKKSLKEMGDFQKLILLTIAVVVPAGILIATILVKFLKSRKK
ncbi:MAG: hypothetical protein MJZ25_06030 [Fibrobacter sp.]|nr:hypothetical protein [Fibrobacter sp.]